MAESLATEFDILCLSMDKVDELGDWNWNWCEALNFIATLEQKPQPVSEIYWALICKTMILLFTTQSLRIVNRWTLSNGNENCFTVHPQQRTFEYVTNFCCPRAVSAQYTAHNMSRMRKSQLARFSAHPFFRPDKSKISALVFIQYPKWKHLRLFSV